MSYKGMHNPAHPGEVLKAMILEPLGLTITHAADLLKVARKTLSEVVNGHSPITPSMAMRIEIAFGSRAGLWIEMQAKRDAWDVEQYRPQIAMAVKPFKPAGATRSTRKPAGLTSAATVRPARRRTPATA